MSKGTIRLGGKEFEVKIEDGERYVKVKGNWLTVGDFVDGLSPEMKDRLAKVGKMALDDEKKGVKPPKGKYQYYAEDTYK